MRRCPSSRFGTSVRLENMLTPMPVPTVSIIRTPSRRPRPTPKFISALPAASASFKIHASHPQALPISSARLTPIKFFPPRLAAVSII